MSAFVDWEPQYGSVCLESFTLAVVVVQIPLDFILCVVVVVVVVLVVVVVVPVAGNPMVQSHDGWLVGGNSLRSLEVNEGQ